MEDFAYRFLSDILREAGELVSPLQRACRSHAHLYRFFLEIGWDLREALGVDLEAVRSHVEVAFRDLQAIRGAVAQEDEMAVALAARDAFRDVMERARPLYDTLVAARPVPVTDEVLQEFVEDLALHLLTAYVARRIPVAFQLGWMLGLIRRERAQPLHASTPDRRLLRYPIERVLVRPRHLAMGALNPALALLSDFRDPDTLIERLRARLDAEADRLLQATRGRGLEGLEVRLEPTGLHLTGGPLPVPAAGAAPIRVPIDVPGTPTVVIGPGGWALTWASGQTPDGSLTLFEIAGVRVFIPARPDENGPATALTLAEAGGGVRVDLVGGLGIELPVDVITGESGDAVRASASVRLTYRQGEGLGASLDELRLQGRFHLGGAGGLRIEQAELVIRDLAFPPPAPTPARPLPFDLKLTGTLLLPDDDFRLELEAEYVDGVWKLRSTGHARFANGVELRPVGTRPVFEAEASPGADRCRFAAAGEIRFPLADGVAGLKAEGALALRMTAGVPTVETFTCRGEATSWALADDLEIQTLAVSLGYEPGRFTAAVAAAIPFGDGFVVEVLDRVPASLAGSVAQPVGLTITEAGGALTATIAGGVRVVFPAELLTAADDPEPVAAEAAGVLTLSSDPHVLPALSALSLALSARRLHLGGADGLIVEDASIAAANIDRLFHPAEPPHPALTLSGTVICPIEASSGRLSLTLKGARFTLVRPDRLPDFEFVEGGGLGVENATPAGFPLELTSASIRLKAGGSLPEVLRPQNLEISIGARVRADFGTMARAIGEIDRVTAEIRAGRPHVVLEGASFGVEDLSLPPMRFSGALGVHNLHDPLNFRMEGVLGGSMQGAAVKALVALRLEQGRPEPVGVCLDVNLGPSGISLAYGFTIQGASGGLSFANTNGDPCSFTTYAGARQPIRTGARSPADRPKPSAGCGCDCPPRSLNILCQPHPDQDLHPGRAILKFSAIEERMWASVPVPQPGGGTRPLGELLDALDRTIRAEIAANPRAGRSPVPGRLGRTGVIRAEAPADLRGVGRGVGRGIDGRARASEIARQVTGALQARVAEIIPPIELQALQPQPPDEVRAAFEALRDVYLRPAEHWAREMTELLAGELGARLERLASGEDIPPLRQLVAEQLYRGVNCPDTTLQVTGSFSYVGVSSFAYVTGGVNVSTAGSVGVIGTLTVFGVPFGQLRAFVTATDAAGNLAPSICGDLRFEIGPVRFGQVCVVYKIPGAVTSFADALARFGGKLGKPLVRDVLARIERSGHPFARRAGFDLDADVGRSLGLLEPTEASQFIATLMSDPAPSEAQARAVALFAAELARDLWAGFNPELTACGEVAPSVFGIELAKLAQLRAKVTKDRLEAEVAFSPLYLLGRVFPIADLFSGMDSARMGVGLTFPTLEGLVTEGLLGQLSGQESFDQTLERGLARILRESTFTLSYQLFPLGMRLVDMQGRLVMPYLTPHPDARTSGWRSPDELPPIPGAPPPPRRREALFAALDAGRLADVTWSGALREVMDLPPRYQQLELQRDYFPHGGVLGAGKLHVPRLLWDAPPVDLLARGLRSHDWGERLRVLISLIKDWVLKTSEAGTLAFYVPAPTPPAAVIDAADIPLRDVVDALTRLDPAALDPDGRLLNAGGYPLHLSFFDGVLRGQLLGLAVGTADVYFQPPAAGGPAEMRVRARVSEDPRLRAWVETAALEFALTLPPGTAALPLAERQSMHQRFTLLLTQLVTLRQQWNGAGPAPANVQFAVTRAVGELAMHLPKVRLAAEVALRVPPELADWIGAASARASLGAYSPLYEPSASGDSPHDVIRRDGGWRLAAELRFKFGELVRCSAAVECLLQLPTALDQPGRLMGAVNLAAVDAFRFLGAPVQMGAARLAFDTGAGPGQPLLSLAGDSTPLAFGALELEPIGAPRLGLELQARRGASGPELALTLSAARVRLPGLDPATPVEIRPDDGLTRISLGTAGGAVKVVAPNGLRLVGPAGRAVLQLDGAITGRLHLSTGLPALDLGLPAGFRVVVFPEDPLLRREAVLPQRTELRVKSDGTFTLQLALPALELAQGLFALHGDAGPTAPLPITITEREARLTAPARLTLRPPGSPASSARLTRLFITPLGAFEASGSDAVIKLAGLVESSAAGFTIARSAAGFELAMSNVELRVPSLPGFTHRWNVKLRPGVFEADLASSGAAACVFGARMSVTASAWRMRGTFTSVELAATSPAVTLLGMSVAPGVQVRLSLTPSQATASLAMPGTRLRLLPGLVEIEPSRADVAWGPGGGRIALAGRLFLLPRLDAGSGWLVEKPFDVALDRDDFCADALARQSQLLARNGLSLSADLGFGRDAQGVYVALRELSGTCLGVALPRVTARIDASGQLLLSWSQSGQMSVGPFALVLRSFALHLQTSTRAVTMRLGGAALQTSAPGWPAGTVTLPELRLAWTAGAPAVDPRVVSFSAFDSDWVTAGPARYRVTTPSVRVALDLGAGASGVSLGSLTLTGARLAVETTARKPDGGPWAGIEQALPDRTVNADGSLTIPLPRLDPGDPLADARSRCRDAAGRDFPLPPWPGDEPRNPLAKRTWRIARDAYNDARGKLDRATAACDVAFPRPPDAARVGSSDIHVKLRDLFRFRS